MIFNDLGGMASSGQSAYSFLDKAPPLATDLYRLKIVDLNGTVTKSNIVPLSFGNAATLAKSSINVYPNPASSVLNLAIMQNGVGLASGPSPIQLNGSGQGLSPQSYDIKIINITGSVIKSETSANASWQSNVSSLSPGTYVIQVVNNKDKSLVGRGTFVKM